MNKDNAKDFLPLVQALVNGKTLQYLQYECNGWVDTDHLNTIVHDPDEYRINPLHLPISDIPETDEL